MSTRPYRKTSLTPDVENSTFYCQTTFTDGTQDPMIGYSKMVGYTEPKDKSVCLFNMQFRLFEQGYMRDGRHYNTRGNLIKPIAHMAYYLNHTNVPVYFFFPTHAEPQTGFDWAAQFVEKVDNFYADKHAGASLALLRSKYYVTRVKALIVQDDFDLSNPRFHSDVALRGYADGLRAKNFPAKQIEEFIRKYSQKFFINGKMNPKLWEEYRINYKKQQHAQETNELDAAEKAKARQFQQHLKNGFPSQRAR